MALKKSQLYPSLWQSCDELHGGIDASTFNENKLDSDKALPEIAA